MLDLSGGLLEQSLSLSCSPLVAVRSVGTPIGVAGRRRRIGCLAANFPVFAGFCVSAGVHSFLSG